MLRKVMVVNDDEISLFVSSKIISKTGFATEVVTAKNGANALQIFDSLLLKGAALPGDIPELVFLDLHMPVMDGWEFMEVFTEKYAYIFPSVKFVILSSSIDPDDMEKIQQFPSIVELIKNPISFGILEQFKDKLLHEGTLHTKHQPSDIAGQMIA